MTFPADANWLQGLLDIFNICPTGITKARQSNIGIMALTTGKLWLKALSHPWRNFCTQDAVGSQTLTSLWWV